MTDAALLITACIAPIAPFLGALFALDRRSQ
jgi:hypothetical protein